MTSFAHPELFEQLHTSSTQAKLNPKQLTYWSKQSATVANLLKVPKKIAQFNSSYIQSYPYLILDYRQDAKQIAKLIVSTKADKDNKVMFQLFTLHKVMQLTCQQLDFECYIKAYQDISIKDVDSSLQGRAIGKAIEHARICAIASCLKKID
ncbi:hypothetical protein [Psychrobacter lutiphocae]|nr:hypothetical protein [Psychrobacter lutiphocae]